MQIAFTGENTVPARAVPVATMTFAPKGGVSPVDAPTCFDRLSLEFIACCGARPDRTPVRTARVFTTMHPSGPGGGSRGSYRRCDEGGDLSSGHSCKRHLCFLPAPE